MYMYTGMKNKFVLPCSKGLDIHVCIKIICTGTNITKLGTWIINML